MGRLWSVRVGLHRRAVAVEDGAVLVWFRIGTHAEYDQLLGQRWAPVRAPSMEDSPVEDGPLDASRWFDLWHVHPDQVAGVGRWAALRAAWAKVEAAGRAAGRPWQSWVLIDPADARDDAVYLHTPNPNRDNFPYAFEDVSWGAEPPTWLGELVDPLTVELGRSEHDGASLYWVRRSPAVA